MKYGDSIPKSGAIDDYASYDSYSLEFNGDCQLRPQPLLTKNTLMCTEKIMAIANTMGTYTDMTTKLVIIE